MEEIKIRKSLKKLGDVIYHQNTCRSIRSLNINFSFSSLPFLSFLPSFFFFLSFFFSFYLFISFLYFLFSFFFSFFLKIKFQIKYTKRNKIKTKNKKIKNKKNKNKKTNGSGVRTLGQGQHVRLLSPKRFRFNQPIKPLKNLISSFSQNFLFLTLCHTPSL